MIPLKILIGMPSGRGQVSAATLGSLMALMETFRESGIATKFACIEAADIVYARNAMASLVASRTDFTHLFFVDDDMTFGTDAVFTMLRADKPVIGCICTKRQMHPERIYEAAKRGESLSAAMAHSVDFIVQHIPNAEIQVKDGMCPVAAIGMAVTLIRRDALMTMIEKRAVEARSIAGGPDVLGNEKLYSFFEQIYSEGMNALLSEDISFCARWRDQCQGEIWAVVNQEIGHVGQMPYKGRYLDLLKTGKF